MKVGIFAFPRTSSTMLAHTIGQSIGEVVFEEPITILPDFESKYDCVHTIINPATAGVFKFMGHNFLELSWQTVNWKSFDKVIFVERHDIALSCMSTYIAQSNWIWQHRAGRAHRPVVGGEVPYQFVIDFVNGVRLYFDIKSKLEKLTKTITVFYEDADSYQEYVASYLGIPKLIGSGPYEPSGLDYRVLCTNQQQVTDWINELWN